MGGVLAAARAGGAHGAGSVRWATPAQHRRPSSPRRLGSTQTTESTLRPFGSSQPGLRLLSLLRRSLRRLDRHSPAQAALPSPFGLSQRLPADSSAELSSLGQGGSWTVDGRGGGEGGGGGGGQEGTAVGEDPSDVVRRCRSSLRCIARVINDAVQSAAAILTRLRHLTVKRRPTSRPRRPSSHRGRCGGLFISLLSPLSVGSSSRQPLPIFLSSSLLPALLSALLPFPSSAVGALVLHHAAPVLTCVTPRTSLPLQSLPLLPSLLPALCFLLLLSAPHGPSAARWTGPPPWPRSLLRVRFPLPVLPLPAAPPHPLSLSLHLQRLLLLQLPLTSRLLLLLLFLLLPGPTLPQQPPASLPPHSTAPAAAASLPSLHTPTAPLRFLPFSLHLLLFLLHPLHHLLPLLHPLPSLPLLPPALHHRRSVDERRRRGLPLLHRIHRRPCDGLPRLPPPSPPLPQSGAAARSPSGGAGAGRALALCSLLPSLLWPLLPSAASPFGPLSAHRPDCEWAEGA